MRQVELAPSLYHALSLIVTSIKGALPIDACGVFLSDAANGHFILMAAEGLEATSPRDHATGPPSPVDLVAERRELVVMTDVAARPPYAFPPGTAEARYGSFLGVPLIHYHRVLGVRPRGKRLIVHSTRTK